MEPQNIVDTRESQLYEIALKLKILI